MRSIVITLIFSLMFHFSGLSQVADGINYQAVALDADGNEIVGTDADWSIIENKQFNVRFSVLEGTSDGPVLYQETHLAHTDPFGMFSLVIGHGLETGEGAYQKLIDISWGSGKLFLKVEIDIDRTGAYRDMDIQQMMAVPFAFHALSAGKPSVVEAAADHDPEEPIFSIKNSKGEIVFAVYESGVVINIEESDEVKGSRGGFAVGGFSTSKQGDYVEYLRVDPGYVRITIDDTVEEGDLKGSRGGFAVGGFSALKQQEVSDYFHLTPGSALFRLDSDYVMEDKGSRGGFAVGGFSTLKSDLFTEYLRVTSDSVRVYIDDSPEEGDIKGSRGGFAVGGFSALKQGDGFEYLRIDPGFVRVGIDESADSYDLKGSRAGFAVGGFSSMKKTDAIDYLYITPSSAQFLLDEDSGKGSRAGFAVGGFSALKGGGINDYLNLTYDSARVYVTDGTDGRGGFAVTERTGNKGIDYDVLYVSPERTSVYLKENRKNLPDGFSVFNRDADYVERLFSVTEEGTFVATLFTIAPVLSTSEVTGVTTTTAIAGGTVIRDGGALVTERGVVFGQLASPTAVSGEKVVAEGTGEGVFSVNLTGLLPGTRYYVRAYGINSAGTGYGEQVEFTTAAE